MNKNKFMSVFLELNKFNNSDFSQKEVIEATKNLIKYSKNEYINKSELRSYSNDNRKSLDTILKQNNFSNYNNYFDEHEYADQEELNQYKNFKKYNNLS